MTAGDWRSVITQAAGLGVSMVQFIGGEPTLHPDFAALLAHAVGAGLAAEVYSNLTHVRDSWWELLACPKVSLATSYYSDDPGEHDAITGRPGSHARTLANIGRAVSRGIPVRAGIIELADGQRTSQARAELEAIGVRRIRTDRVRRLGRAASAAPDVSELCGNCGRGIAAVLPSGDVCPCVMARWLTAGNVRDMPLAAILSGPALAAATAVIPARSRRTTGNPDAASACGPDCAPASDSDICPPPAGSACGPDCAPASDSDICPPPAGSACSPDCGPASDSDICPPQGGTVLYAIGSRGESA
jgi:MoaA/NifB/PqqE/SkfB family radical SAM enzyme